MISSLLINKLHVEASKSIIEHKLSAAIIKHNKIIGKPYCNIPKSTSYVNIEGTIHAEINTINNWEKNIIKKKSKINIIVIRINKCNERCNARPCYNCLLTMKKIGIKKIYYSVNKTDIICENIKDMISIQITSYNRSLLNYNKSLSIYKYYESILLNIFTDEIKFNNLMNFINYNFYNVLPNYKIIINNSIVIIIDSNNNIIKTSLII